jgi:hypothetical protein
MSNNHNASISECSIANDLNINFNNADSLITKPDIKVNNETSKHFTSYPSRQADRQDLKQSSKSQINKSPVITGMFRVREDTAKYLKDLDSSSVQDYDPKRRALKLPISQGGDLIPENEASDLIPVWDQHLKPSDTKIIKENPILKMDFVDKPDPALEMYGPILTANPDDFIEASDTFIDYGATATTRKFVPSRKS